MNLVASGVSFAYRRSVVLQGVSLEVRPGELLGLIGPNGAGKSSLLRCLAGAARPSAGRVLAGGSDLRELSAREIARRIALVPQASVPVFGASVEHFVGLGRYAHERFFGGPSARDREVVARCLRDQGLEAMRGRAVHELSGGEFRRVLLAQALAQEASILLFDEPIQQLDLEHQIEVLEHIRSRTAERGRAGVVVLHELGMAARYCDTLALLHGGQLVVRGSAEEVLTPERLRAVFGVEALVEQCSATGSLHVLPLRRAGSPSVAEAHPASTTL